MTLVGSEEAPASQKHSAGSGLGSARSLQGCLAGHQEAPRMHAHRPSLEEGVSIAKTSPFFSLNTFSCSGDASLSGARIKLLCPTAQGFEHSLVLPPFQQAYFSAMPCAWGFGPEPFYKQLGRRTCWQRWNGPPRGGRGSLSALSWPLGGHSLGTKL